MFGQQDDAAPTGGDNGQAMMDNTAPDDGGVAPQDNADHDMPMSETPAPAPTDPAPQQDQPAGASPDDQDLLELKQNALQQLAPLVSQLEQNPEEKFRTTMMLIQASDNASLLKEAYEAASAIPDEKAKAQALLDVVNEINYFTQPHHDEE